MTSHSSSVRGPGLERIVARARRSCRRRAAGSRRGTPRSRPISGSTSSRELRREAADAAQVAARDGVLRLDRGREALDDRAVAAARLGEQGGVEVDDGPDDVDVDEPVAVERRPRRRRARRSWSASRSDRRTARRRRGRCGRAVGRRPTPRSPARRREASAARPSRRSETATSLSSAEVSMTTRCGSGPSCSLSGSSRRPTGIEVAVIADCRSQRLQPEALGSDQQVIPAVTPARSFIPMVSCPGCPRSTL